MKVCASLRSLGVAVIGVAALTCVPSAVAEVPQFSSYTLDGQSSTKDEVDGRADNCSSGSKPDTAVCFTTAAKQARAAADALRAGELPAGWSALPSPDEVKGWINKYDAAANRGLGSRPPGAIGATAARKGTKKSRRVIARKRP